MAKKAAKNAARKTDPKKESAAQPPSETCFVIMPFGGWLDDYYTQIYCPAIISAGLNPHRADDLFRPSTIVNDIWAYTKKAKVLLADLTGKNPNVFYELGLAHAIAKPAILIAESMDDIPFDLRALRIILFDKNAPDWGSILKHKIQASLQEVLSAPAEAVLPAFLDVRSSGAKPTVSAEQKEFIEIKQELDLLRREIRNRDLSMRHSMPKDEISPDDARSLIRAMINVKESDDIIIKRLGPLGPPTDWLIREIKLARIEASPSNLAIGAHKAPPTQSPITLENLLARKPDSKK